MVMHARKHPRLSDGYFDRTQSHSYESREAPTQPTARLHSVRASRWPGRENASKYPKSNTDRLSEKVRGSPIASNSDISIRNDNAENKNSPRYHRSCTLRLTDKEHHEEASSKSPITRESKGSFGSSVNSKDNHKTPSSTDLSEGSSAGYQSNHDRSGSEESERRLQVGDWSEHISSSGKKYYYNCKTEVSQWEKPKELIEYERQQSLCRLSYESSRSKDRIYDRQCAASGSKNSHGPDVDISPDRSEPFTCHSDSGSHSRLQVPSATYLPVQQSLNSQSSQVQTHLLSPSQVTLSNLPKLISQLAGTKGLPNLSELSPQEALRTIQQALQLTKQVTNLSQTDVHVQKTSSSPAQPQSQVMAVNHHPAATQSCSTQNSNVCQLNNSSTILMSYVQQQQQQHGNASEKIDADRGQFSPGSDSSTHSSRHGSPTSSVSSLHSLNTTATSSLPPPLKTSIACLTPSLANYYCEDLISHVMGWQADHAERQANRYWEEGHNIGSLNCAQVSAELKMARALVRFAEIQSTLQEQRVLFLRQQIKELEDWRSQNSFMSDS